MSLTLSFSNYLIEKNILSSDLLQEAEQERIVKQQTLIYYLATEKIIPAAVLAKATADYFDLPLLELAGIDKTVLPADLFNLSLVQQHYVIPLYKKEDEVCFAVIDPSMPLLNQLYFYIALPITFVILDIHAFDEMMNEISNKQLVSGLDKHIFQDLKNVQVTALENVENFNVLDKSNKEDAPVVRFIDKILWDAVNKDASDIHFEPYETEYRIRFRQDGILYSICTVPKKLTDHLASRLKVMANLDIAERRLPQDGRFKLSLLKTRAVDFRMSTCPTLFGEKIVLRILNNKKTCLTIEALGMTQKQETEFVRAINKSQGLILVTGPTGSGKTVTLYSALALLNDAQKNISTVEDPIEIYLSGINQVAINNKIGLSFSHVLRSFLRQDPDVMMVGEIRDLETAEVAIKAAQTGHLVFASLHTNSAAETIVRLNNMGIAPFNIASSISLIIAQRLIRKLCVHCKQKEILPEKICQEHNFTKTENKRVTAYTAIGCAYCVDGYKGRVGLFEIIPVSNEMRQLILAGASAAALAAQASVESWHNLRHNGIRKIQEGLTSLTELNRVL